MGLFDMEKPISKLDRHRVLAPKAVCVFAHPTARCDVASATSEGHHVRRSGQAGHFERSNAFYKLGGNFIDTANPTTDRS